MEPLRTFIQIRITLPWELSPGSSPNLKLCNPRPLPHSDHNRKGAENRSPAAGAAGWRKSLWTLCWNVQLWNKIRVLEVWAIDTKPEFMKFGMSFEHFKISMKEGVENSVTKPSEFTVITVDWWWRCKVQGVSFGLRITSNIGSKNTIANTTLSHLDSFLPKTTFQKLWLQCGV